MMLAIFNKDLHKWSISLAPVRSQAPRGEARQDQAGAAPTSEPEPALVSVECQGSVRVRHSRGWHSRAPGGIIGHSSWHHITCCRSLASAWILSDMRTVTSDTEGAGHLSSVWCEKKVLRNFMRCSDVVSIVLYWSISPFVKFDKFDIDIKIKTILTIFIKIKPRVFFVFILNWKIHYWLF